MTAVPIIRLNPNLELRKESIGEGHFCVVVDEFLTEPQALVDFACANATRFSAPSAAGYPGLMLALGPRLLDDFYRFIRTRMSKLFSFLRGTAELKTGLSMTTLQPEQLSNFQRLCHTDPRASPGRRNYAALVYLYANEQLGGTAFYRWKKPEVVHKALALELQDPAIAAGYLAEHTIVFRQPPCYMTASNELAELVTVIQPRFNRMIFYSGEIPHSGHITAPALLSEDFSVGRLTLNCFASVIPR